MHYNLTWFKNTHRFLDDGLVVGNKKNTLN